MFEQERFLVRLQQHILRESRLAACFLAGSYGRRREDPYSDLDVVLVCRDEAAREGLWRERQSFVDAAMPYVQFKSFDADHIRPYFHIALYANGTKADYLFSTKTELTPNPYHRDIRVLKDDAGWAEAYQAQSAQTYLQQPRLSSEELKRLDDRFWVMFWDVFRQVLRGEFDKPFPVYLQMIHSTLPPLLAVLPEEDGTRRPLLRARFGYTQAETLSHLSALLGAYLDARRAVVSRYTLSFSPNSTFENAIQRMVEKHSN